jgi:hypothetical protein
MTVESLTIRGASDTRNVLLLNYFGTAVPLTVLNGLTLQDNARIVNRYSALVVQGGTLLVTNAEISQDGGLVRATNATMYLQNSQYDLTNGIVEGGQVLLGSPVSASFNQYGGTAIISDLAFGRGSSGAGGNYALYGGYLSLPNGLAIMGDNNASSSYFQAGGTNRTTNVSLEAGLFGMSPRFTLNNGSLADHNVNMVGDDFGAITIAQNGGNHTVSNTLTIAGGTDHGQPRPSAYRLNGGTLSARTIMLAGHAGDAWFIQSNGIAQAQQIQADAPAAENFLLGFLHAFAELFDLFGFENGAEGGEQDGIFAGFVGAVHADEAGAGLDEFGLVVFDPEFVGLGEGQDLRSDLTAGAVLGF